VASFTGLDLAGDVPVNLDSARALGGLNFADTNPATAGNWILAGSQLDLAGGSTVDVGAMAATSAVTINNVIGGTTGLTKTGAGQLTLAASNLFTGGVRVSGGTLRVNGSVAAQSTQLSGNGTINVQATIGNLAVVAGQAGKVVLRAGSGFLGNTTGPTGIGATGPGASLTVEASFTGGTVSNVDGSWTVGTPLAQVNFVGTGASASTYRLRVNGGGFVTTNWTNTLVNLEKATLTTLTGSLGNRVNLGGLSGNSAGILNGGIGAGGIATYEVGALNTDTTFAGSFTAGRGLNFDKVGTGKLTLSGTLTSMVGPVAGAGLVRVRGGTLALVGATNINAATTVTVETPGVLDVSGSTPVYSTGAALVLGGNGTIAGAYLHDKGTLRPGNAVNQGATLTFANDLTLGGAAAGAVLTQDVTPSLTAGNDKLQVNGNLTVGDFGTVNVNFIGGAASGAYVIAESANAIVDGAKITNAANWVVNWGARGAAPALSIDPTGKKVLMSVSAAGAFSLDWANDGGGAWDVNNTANFVSATGSGAAEKYFQLDAAMFRDSFNNGAGGQTALSGGNKTITLATQVSPSSVTFSNSNVDYTVEGTGKITGTTGLTKEGAGAVILTTVNDYSGPTVIRGGRLQLWSFTADGTLGSGGITLENGGTLSLRNSTTSAFSAALNVAPTGGVLENNMAGLRQLSGSITGSGELVLTTQETTKGVDMIVNQAGFTGKLTVGPAVFFRFNNSGLANAELSIDGAAPAVGTTGAVFSTDIGALSGSGPLYGYLSSAGGGPVTYRIGGKNLPTATFSGLIANNRSDVNTQTLNITKVGSGVQVLSGSLSYTGATTVEAGELQLATSLRSSASLQVLDGAVATLAAGGSNALVTTAINLGGTGVLNTNDNDLVINYGGASPIASLIAFYNGGQIVAAADSAGLPTYLAISEAGDLGITDLGGISVDETTVIGKYTYVGDANLDGQVDALDYERVDLAIGNSGVAGTAQGDLNYDGNVDALDYEQIDLNIGNGVGSLLGSVLVPEPASGALLGLAVGMLSRRNRRRD
jgi:autotransporter-associated beta strand protein